MSAIVVTPPVVGFGIFQEERPIEVTVNSEVVGLAGHARAIFNFSNTPAVNQFIEINGVRFVVVAGDSENPLEISNAKALEDFVNKFNAYPQLNYKYKAFVSNISTFADITITAVEPGSKFDITINQSVTGWVLVTNDAGTNENYGEGVDNYGISVRVYHIGDNTFGVTTGYEFAGELIKNFSKDNVYKFDISGLLRGFIPKILPNLSDGNFQSYFGDDAFAGQRKFYYEVFELEDVGGVRVRNIRHRSSVYNITRGNKPFITWDNEFRLSPPTKFLSTDFAAKPVYREHSEQAFFFCQTSANKRLIVKLRFRNGTIREINTPLEDLTLLSGQSGIFSKKVGFMDLGLDAEEAIEANEILWYSIRVNDGTASDDTIEKIYMPYKDSFDPVLLAFRNDLGVIEHFSFNGQKQQAANYSAGLVDVSDTSDDKTVPLKEVVDVEAPITMKVNSNLLDRDTYDKLRALLEVKESYIVDGNDYVPIVITSIDYPGNRRTNEYYFNIEFQHTQNQVVI